jgi:hypothetical protein
MGAGTISEMKNLRRTAAFADPAGHVWELAHEI